MDFLNQAYPTQMSSFEKSPVGVPVVLRTVKNDVEAQTQVVRDIKNLIGNEEIKPGSIVILLNGAKEQSCLAQTKSIAGYPLVSTYGEYDPQAKQIYYSTIAIFKGLEADVILLVLDGNHSSKEVSKSIYIQGSRANIYFTLQARISTQPLRSLPDDHVLRRISAVEELAGDWVAALPSSINLRRSKYCKNTRTSVTHLSAADESCHIRLYDCDTEAPVWLIPSHAGL